MALKSKLRSARACPVSRSESRTRLDTGRLVPLAIALLLATLAAIPSSGVASAQELHDRIILVNADREFVERKKGGEFVARPIDDHGTRPGVLVVFEDAIAASHFLRVAREQIQAGRVTLPLWVSHKEAIDSLGPLGRARRTPAAAWELLQGVSPIER